MIIKLYFVLLSFILGAGLVLDILSGSMNPLASLIGLLALFICLAMVIAPWERKD